LEIGSDLGMVEPGEGVLPPGVKRGKITPRNQKRRTKRGREKRMKTWKGQDLVCKNPNMLMSESQALPIQLPNLVFGTQKQRPGCFKFGATPGEGARGEAGKLLRRELTLPRRGGIAQAKVARGSPKEEFLRRQ